MYYISIQAIDYDDYPVGSDTKVGTFESAEEAVGWLQGSSLFSTVDYGGGYKEYRPKWSGGGQRYSVRVRELAYGLMTTEYFEELYSRHAK